MTLNLANHILANPPESHGEEYVDVGHLQGKDDTKAFLCQVHNHPLTSFRMNTYAKPRGRGGVSFSGVRTGHIPDRIDHEHP
jgi:hypothetical protein